MRCEIHLIIWGFPSPSAPSPTPTSPQEEDEYSDVSPSYVFCFVYRGSDDVFHLRCWECAVWAEEVLFVAFNYASPIDTLESIQPWALTPPPYAPSVPSPQPALQSDVDFRITLFKSQLAAPQALFVRVPDPQASCPARLQLDARSPIL